jgi:hypothetical protein
MKRPATRGASESSVMNRPASLGDPGVNDGDSLHDRGWNNPFEQRDSRRRGRLFRARGRIPEKAGNLFTKLQSHRENRNSLRRGE